MELKGYSRPTCNKLRARCVQPRCVDRHKCRQQTRLSASFVDNTNRPPLAKFSKSRVWDEVPDRSAPYIWRYSNFLITQCRIGGKKFPHQKVARISSRFDTIPACGKQNDRRTDKQIHDDCKYRASIASRDKKFVCMPAASILS